MIGTDAKQPEHGESEAVVASQGRRQEEREAGDGRLNACLPFSPFMLDLLTPRRLRPRPPFSYKAYRRQIWWSCRTQLKATPGRRVWDAVAL
jgi:hypothetical protein